MLISGGLGLAGGLFGGGGGGAKPPPMPSLGKKGKALQAELYPQIERGMLGEGLTPGITSRSIQQMLAATQKQFGETQYDLPGTLGRMVPQADVKVRQFIRQSIDRQFAQEQRGIKDIGVWEKYEDVGRAQSMAFDALSGEKRMGTAITGMYNQAAMQGMNAPTFQSQLAGGVGGAVGIMMAGPIGYANMFSSTV